MDEIRSWWEVPCVAHYCHIFRRPFKLPDFDIEELEDALLLDYAPSPSQLLVELFCKFLNGIVDKQITEENWEFFLKLHVEWRCEYLSDKWNPFVKEKQYKDLTIRERIQTLHKLCHWRLELDDIADLLRGIDGPSLRLEALGKDAEGSVYYYFFGTRLYKEEKRKRKKDTPTVTPGKRGRGKATPASRGRNTPKSRSARRRRGTQEDADVSTPESRRGKSGRHGNTIEENGIENGDSGSSDDAESEVKGQPPTNVNENDTKIGGMGSTTGWSVACSTVEEWSELIESFEGTKHQETKRLRRNLQELLPEVEYLVVQKEKELKRKMLAELPRRTSDRIALKAQQRLEEERLEAIAREMQREELRRLQAEEEQERLEQLEQQRQRKREEALERRKAKEEAQQKQREEEEKNWTMAMSGELSGRRKAAIGAAENVSEDQLISQQFQLVEGRDEDLYTAMYKILAGLRGQEDAWVFEDPVTEAIAPGYFEVIDTPMDYTTVEKKLETNQYKSKEEFSADIELIYENCIDYNGEDSEYAELAKETSKTFQLLFKQHIEGEVPIDDEGKRGKSKRGRKARESRSPSACKTPELTSESSSDEEEESDDSDESFTVGKKSAKKIKGKTLKLPPGLERKMDAMSSGGHFQLPHPGMPQARPPPGMFPPHVPPQYYHHYMHQQRMRMVHPEMRYRPPHGMPPPYPGQPNTGDMLNRHHGLYPPAHPGTDGRHMYPYPHHQSPHYPPHYHMQQQQQQMAAAAYHQQQQRAHVPPGTPPAMRTSGTPPAMRTSGTPPAVRSSGTPPAMQTSGTPPAVRSSGTPPAVRSSGTPPAAVRQTSSPATVTTGRHSSSPGVNSPSKEPSANVPTQNTSTDDSKSKDDITLSDKGQSPTSTTAGQTSNEGETSEGKVQTNNSTMTPEMIHHHQQQQYRYHQQMMAMQHRHGSYGYGPQAPPPGYNPSQRPRMDMSDYYGWHQMRSPLPPPDGRPGHFDQQQHHQYWKEMELRRRQQYYAAAMSQHKDNQEENADSAKYTNEQLYWREMEMRRRHHHYMMMKQKEAERMKQRTMDGDGDTVPVKTSEDQQPNKQHNEPMNSGKQKPKEHNERRVESANEDVPDKQHSNDESSVSNQNTSDKQSSTSVEDASKEGTSSNSNISDAKIPPRPEATPTDKQKATPTSRPHLRSGYPPYHHMMSNGYPPMAPDYPHNMYPPYHQQQHIDHPMMSSGGPFHPPHHGRYYPPHPRMPYYPPPPPQAAAATAAMSMRTPHMPYPPHDMMSSEYGRATHYMSREHNMKSTLSDDQLKRTDDGQLSEEQANPVETNPVQNLSQNISDSEEPPAKRSRVEQ